jgi:hypothetical protein
MTNLGVLYDNGYGVEQSDELAIYWYRKGGQEGRAGSIEPSKKTASSDSKLVEATPTISDMQNKASRGDPAAQFELGKMHAAGTGVLQDYVLAYMWINLSIAAGNTDAVSSREALVQRMTTSQINEAQQLAGTWKSSSK